MREYKMHMAPSDKGFDMQGGVSKYFLEQNLHLQQALTLSCNRQANDWLKACL